MSERVLTVEDMRVDLPLAAGTLHAVQGVSFHVDRGETLCIVGEFGLRQDADGARRHGSAARHRPAHRGAVGAGGAEPRRASASGPSPTSAATAWP